MPKPNGGKFNNKQPSWKNSYSEHDFRGGNETRRVSFKNNRTGNVKRDNKDWTASIRAHLQDEDIDMGTSSGGGRNFKKHFKGKRGGNRSGSPAPINRFVKRKLLEGPVGWFRVTLPYGNKYEKDFVLRTLLQKLEPLPLWPIMWRVQGTTVTFYLDEFKVAEKLNDLDREIEMPDGFKLIIKVHTGLPPVDVNSQLKDKIKQVMAKRYTLATKALDLTKFHADPDLKEHFCALFKPIVFLTIVDVIVENIPEIEALNLEDNKLSNIFYLKKLNEKLPQLKILHLANNRFRDISMLDPLIGLPLIDMVLNGNPLCLKFKDQESYIGEVRTRFPKVMKLDGIELPPPIGFDISAEVSLPPPMRSFWSQQEGESIVKQFVEQYFSIYDSDSRQPLIQAYHESAVFSMTSAYPYGQQKDKSSSWLNWYTSENRNLMRITDPERRSKLLKQGQVAVVMFLQEMPFTQHDINSFTVDLTLCVPQMISFTLTGLFKELRSGHKSPPIRHFFRTFIIVPSGPGFCIINETVHITNALDDQIKYAFKAPAVVVARPPPPHQPTVVSSPPAAVPPTPVTSPIVAVPTMQPIPNEVLQQQMVQALAQQSGMNLEWSAKCLTETQWDFQRAITVFTDLHKDNKIPAEAFIK